jgi:outer membrane protein assembly factor BamB
LVLGDLAWGAPFLLSVDSVHHRILAVDTWSGQVQGSLKMIRSDVNAIAIAKGLLWQASTAERLVFAVDLSNNNVVHQLPFPTAMASVQSLDADDSSLWLGDPSSGNLVALDLASGTLKHEYALDRYVSGVACSRAGVYFSETGSGIIGCVEPLTGRMIKMYEVVGKPASLVCVGSRLWYVDSEYHQITELLLR